MRAADSPRDVRWIWISWIRIPPQSGVAPEGGRPLALEPEADPQPPTGKRFLAGQRVADQPDHRRP